MKIYCKSHQIALFKKFAQGSVPPKPTSKRLATPRVASLPWQILHTPKHYY